MRQTFDKKRKTDQTEREKDRQTDKQTERRTKRQKYNRELLHGTKKIDRQKEGQR